MSVSGGGPTELLAASTPTPLSAVVVSHVVTAVHGHPAPEEAPRAHLADVLVVRRRWLSGGLVEELTLRNPHPRAVAVEVDLEVAADFAHVFDVKSGVVAAPTSPPCASSTARIPIAPLSLRERRGS